MFDIIIKEMKKDKMNSIKTLFNEHQNEPFTYVADACLFKMFSWLKPFRAFVAEVDGQVIGCIYGLRYLFGYGWIGGLLIHKNFRRLGIGRRLLGAILDFLGPGYSYLFVEPQNLAAKRLFENMSFKAVYRRLNYLVQTPLAGFQTTCDNITCHVEWGDVNEAIGFKERGGVINMGYYPVKVTENIFEDLRRERKVLKCGSVVAFVENSWRVNINGYEFTFNDNILREMPILLPKKRVVEVIPFYIRPELSDLAKLINHLTAQGEVIVWAYEQDPVIWRLPLKGVLGVMVMEHYK